MVKPLKGARKKPGKLHVEIPRANWTRMEAYLKGYNDDPGRMTPKLKVAHIINEALVQYLSGRCG